MSHIIETQNESFLPDINAEITKKKGKPINSPAGEYFDRQPNTRGATRGNKAQAAISSPINPFVRQDISNRSLSKSQKKSKNKAQRNVSHDRNKTAEGSQRRVAKSSSNNAIVNQSLPQSRLANLRNYNPESQQLPIQQKSMNGDMEADLNQESLGAAININVPAQIRR